MPDTCFEKVNAKGLAILAELLESTTDAGTSFERKAISPGFLASASCLVFLESWKGGFVFGADHGAGFAIARLAPQDHGTATWTAPCFVTFTRYEVGAILGLEKVHTLMASLTRRGLQHLASGHRHSFGADIAIQMWPLRALQGVEDQVSMDVLGMGTDWIVASAGKGVLIDVALADGSLKVDAKANSKAYGKDVSAEDLLSGNVPRPAELAALYSKLNELSRQARG